MKLFIQFIFILVLAGCTPNHGDSSAKLVPTRTAIIPTATNEAQLIQLPFRDGFSDNRLNWPTGSWEDDYKSNLATVGSDKLSIQMKSKESFLQRIFPKNAPAIPSKNAFVYSLDTHIEPVSSKQMIGIALIKAYGQSGKSHEFAFWVTSHEYHFGLRANGIGKTIIGDTASPSINPNGNNRLSLALHGITFTLKINDQQVAIIDVDEAEQVDLFQAGIVCGQDAANVTTTFEFDNYEIESM